MPTVTVAIPKTKGGAFLIETRAPEDIFTPEDFTEEHHAIPEWVLHDIPAQARLATAKRLHCREYLARRSCYVQPTLFKICEPPVHKIVQPCCVSAGHAAVRSLQEIVRQPVEPLEHQCEIVTHELLSAFELLNKVSNTFDLSEPHRPGQGIE